MSRTDGSMLHVFFQSLADSRRRLVLSSLLDDSDGAVQFDELVDDVIEAETPSPSPDRDSIEITLDHRHLPMLANQGLIEYDREERVVMPTSRTEQLGPYLAVVEDLEGSEEVLD